MNKDFTVLIEYRNRENEKVGERSFEFQEYVNIIKLEITRIIMDVEDAFYRVNGQRQKENWDPKDLESFNHIKHKLLDQANSVSRLPETLRYKGVPCNSKTLSEYIADIVNNSNL